MNTDMNRNWMRIFLFSQLFVIVCFFSLSLKAHAQDASCIEVLKSLADGIDYGTCQQVDTDNACYASETLLADFRKQGLIFKAPNDRVNIFDLRSLVTQGPTGSAVMYANSPEGPVRVVLFGNTNITPEGGEVFTMQKTGTGMLCERTPSGMMVQTKRGETGQVVVNGVTIRLRSTAFISMDGIVFFDQDPRIGRRLGERNPTAPLCSGFDSDCNFENCQVNFRLVWGPYCRENDYPYVEPGLYRVTLFGTGTVQAGATDYGVANELFAYGSQRLTLPASYTFCYPGLQPGGGGFETIVRSLTQDARVDRIRLEYLGGDCANAWTGPSSNTSIMTVVNVEGTVEVSIPGATVVLQEGEWVRIILVNNQPVNLGAPRQGIATLGSEVVLWLSDDPRGLPWVNENRPPGGTDPRSGGASASRPSTGELADKIVFWSSRDYSYEPSVRSHQMVGEIYAINPDGTSLRRVSSNLRIGGLFPPHPIVNPEGTEIVIKNFSDNTLEFYSPSGNLIETIPGLGWIEQVHDWSLDGQKILLNMRDEQDSSNSVNGLYIYKRSTGEFTLVTDDNASYTPASWSPDGSRIAYVQSGTIWITNIDGSQPIELISGSITELDWSPNGDQIAYIQSGDIFLVNVDGTTARNLTNSSDVYESGVTWSPDGTRLAYADSGTTFGQIYVIDVSTGQSTQLTSEGDNRYPYWVSSFVLSESSPNPQNDPSAGIYLLRGYYVEEEVTAWGQTTTCDRFVVTDGDQQIITEFLELVANDNSINRTNELGQLVMTIDLTPISTDIAGKILSSKTENLVELLVRKRQTEGFGAPACYSFVEIIGMGGSAISPIAGNDKSTNLLIDHTGLIGSSNAVEGVTEVFQMLQNWDEIHREAIDELRIDRLPSVLAEKALDQQLQTIQKLNSDNCRWSVDMLAPPVLTKLTFTNSEEAVARILKNWNMDYVCNGKSNEVPEQDGEYIAVYRLKLTVQGWRIVEKNVDDVTAEDILTPVNSFKGNLPAPLYFIDDTTKQIHRVEIDGSSTQQITNEPNQITYFDVSPIDGSLIYVTNNTLIQTNSFGKNRFVKVVGEEVGTESVTNSYFEKQILQPAFSPDGQSIVFGLNGINVIATGSSKSYDQILANNPGASDSPLNSIGYREIAWSPDGSKIALFFTLFEGFGNSLYDLKAKKEIPFQISQFTSPTNIADRRDLAWARDGGQMFMASAPCVYCGPAGLSTVNADSGKIDGLILGSPSPNTSANIAAAAPFSLNDQELLLFTTTLSDGFDPMINPLPGFQMSRFSISDRSLTILNNRAFSLGDVLWDTNGTGAVVVQTHRDQNTGVMIFDGSLWLSVAGTQKSLPIQGHGLRWGVTTSDNTNPVTDTFLTAPPDDLVRRSLGSVAQENLAKFAALDPVTGKTYWIAYTTGFFPSGENHKITAFQANGSQWQQVASYNFESDYPPEIYEEGVEQIQIEKSRLWFMVKGVRGVHGGDCYILSMNQGVFESHLAVAGPNPEPCTITDLDGDGTQEVLVNDTNAYVADFASMIWDVRYLLYRWDGKALVKVELKDATDRSTNSLSKQNNLAIAYAKAELWKDADRIVNEIASQYDTPLPTDIHWNLEYIKLMAEKKRSFATSAIQPFVSLLYYGDYEAIEQLLEQSTAGQIFSGSSPVVDPTYRETVASLIQSHTELALTLRPDIASAYFLRAWAKWVTDPRDLTIVDDLQQAFDLHPSSVLYADSLTLFGVPAKPKTAPTPTPTVKPTPKPTATAAPTRTPVPLGSNCTTTADPIFANLWQTRRSLLGCPLSAKTTIPSLAEELFQGGHMFWRSDLDEIYVVYDRNKTSGASLAFGQWRTNPAWKWDGSNPEGIGLTPPSGFFEPKQGFGWVWRTYLDREAGSLGWALDKEYGFERIGQVQIFEQGMMFKGSDARIYVLLNDGRFFAQ